MSLRSTMRLAWAIGLAVVIGFRKSASLLQVNRRVGGVGAVHLLVILYILCNNKLVIYYIQQRVVCVRTALELHP